MELIKQYHVNNIQSNCIDYLQMINMVYDCANIVIHNTYDSVDDLICNNITCTSNNIIINNSNIKLYYDNFFVKLNTGIYFDVIVDVDDNYTKLQCVFNISYIPKVNHKIDVLKVSNQWFRKIVYEKAKQFYAYNSSFYHTIHHIDDMITNMDKLFETRVLNSKSAKSVYLDCSRINTRILFTAICFHDAYYNIMDNKCEQKSAEIMVQCMDKFLPKDYITFIYELILSTQYGMIGDSLMSNIIHDLDYFNFLDYSKLVTAEKQIFNEFLRDCTDDITDELKHTIFYNKRIEFLNKLKTESVFKCDSICDIVDVNMNLKDINKLAKNNIAKLIHYIQTEKLKK